VLIAIIIALATRVIASVVTDNIQFAAESWHHYYYDIKPLHTAKHTEWQIWWNI